MQAILLAQDQLVELLNQMSVTIGDGTFFSWEIAADDRYQVTYLVDDLADSEIIQHYVDLTPVIPGSPLPAPDPMTVTAVNPTSADIGTDDLGLVVTGTEFQPSAVILFGGVEYPTTFVSSTQLVTIIEPSEETAPRTVEIQVKLGSDIQPPSPSPVTFDFTAP